MRNSIYLGVLLLISAPAWTQSSNSPGTGAAAAPTAEGPMLTPPPVSGEAYPVAVDSDERENTLRYGITVSGAYSDNVLGGSVLHPVSDVSYSVWPTIGLRQSTSRLAWNFTYSPGFTFYRRTSAMNEADHNASIAFEYRLSPHVTLALSDTFQRSSSVFNQPDLGSSSIYGGPQGANHAVFAPLADRLSNLGHVTMSYQFQANDMIGAGGSFENLHYPDTSRVPGLSDANSQGGSAFYTHRFSGRHYLGAMYQYQRLLAYPGGLANDTQTHALFLFYTMYPAPRVSLSLFGGPQYANTYQPANSVIATPFSTVGWAPSGGASVNWTGRLTNLTLSYAHTVSGGGGLMEAVRLDRGDIALRQVFTRSFSGSLAASYANDNLLGIATGFGNGHAISGTAALDRHIGANLTLQLAYTRLHQTYTIPLLATTPDTNRESISVSYAFTRPLGR